MELGGRRWSGVGGLYGEAVVGLLCVQNVLSNPPLLLVFVSLVHGSSLSLVSSTSSIYSTVSKQDIKS